MNSRTIRDDWELLVGELGGRQAVVRKLDAEDAQFAGWHLTGEVRRGGMCTLEQAAPRAMSIRGHRFIRADSLLV